MAIQSVNPATGEVVEKFEPTSPADLDRVAAGAQAAFHEWRGVPVAERAAPCARRRGSCAPVRKNSREP